MGYPPAKHCRITVSHMTDLETFFCCISKVSGTIAISPNGGITKHCIYSGALAREARSGAPWVTKCGKLPIRENLVIT